LGIDQVEAGICQPGYEQIHITSGHEKSTSTVMIGQPLELTLEFTVYSQGVTLQSQ